MSVSSETYLRRHWDIQRDVVRTSPRRLVAGWDKTDTLEDELKYKTYKSLFEKLRKNAKISYYSKVLHKFKINSKRNWQVMNGITGK